MFNSWGGLGVHRVPTIETMTNTTSERTRVEDVQYTGSETTTHYLVEVLADTRQQAKEAAVEEVKKRPSVDSIGSSKRFKAELWGGDGDDYTVEVLVYF